MLLGTISVDNYTCVCYYTSDFISIAIFVFLCLVAESVFVHNSCYYPYLSSSLMFPEADIKNEWWMTGAWLWCGAWRWEHDEECKNSMTGMSQMSESTIDVYIVYYMIMEVIHFWKSTVMKSLSKCVYIANVYRELQGLCGEIRVQGFQNCRVYMYVCIQHK